MKKAQATRCKGIISRELSKYAKKYKWDVKPIVEVVESPNSKGWFGVEVRTDGDSYDGFYDDYGGTASNIQQDITNKVNTAMGAEFKKEEHYFEKYGQGIVHFY